MAGFDLQEWKKQAQELIQLNIQDFNHGVITGVSACAFLPFLIASKDPSLAFLASTQFFAIIAGTRGNLLAAEIPNWLSRKNLTVKLIQGLIQESVDQNKDIIDEIDYVIMELGLIEFIENEFLGEEKVWIRDAFYQELENNVHPILSALNLENKLSDNIKVNSNINNITILDDVNSDSKSYILEYYQKMSQKSQFFPLGVIDEDFDNNKKGFEIRTNDIYTELHFSLENFFDNHALHFFSSIQNFKSNNRIGFFKKINSDIDNSDNVLIKKIFNSGIKEIRSYTTIDLIERGNETVLEDKFKSMSKNGQKLIKRYLNQKRQLVENDILSSEYFKNLVILGDPGSGKSTFFNNLTFMKLNFPEKLPKNIRDHLILRINLREVVKFLKTNDQLNAENSIWKTINNDFISAVGEEGGKLGFDQFKDTILASPCIVLFDGFDEVPEFDNNRELVFEAIQSFIPLLNASSRILITMRPYAYQELEWISNGFSTVSILHFSEKQMHSFIEIWYETLKAKGLNWPRDLLDERKIDLKLKISKNSFLLSLARQPLLLTIITTLHTNGGSLPEDRAKLYEKATTLLLSKWQLRYAKKNLIEEELLDINIRKLLSNQPNILRYCMNALAFRAHDNQYSVIKTGLTTQGEISKNDILDVFSDFLPNDIDPIAVIDYISERTGLLLARSNDIFIFPHRSFQEFLSACHILNQPDSIELMKEKVNESPTWWREVYLLAVGRKKENFSDSMNLVTELLPLTTNLRTVSQKQWDVVLLATEALIELRIFKDQIIYKNFQDKINYIRSLLIFIIDQNVYNKRFEDYEKLERVGKLLSIVGDTRKGIGILLLNGIAIPDIDWVSISRSTNSFENAVWVSRNKNSAKFYPNTEKIIVEKTIDKFQISKYPISIGQFQLFAESNEFENPDYWDKDYYEFVSTLSIKNKSNNSFENNEDVRPLKTLKDDILNLKRKNSPISGLNYYTILAYFNWLEKILNLPTKIYLPSSFHLISAVVSGKIYSHFSHEISVNKDSIDYFEVPASIGCMFKNLQNERYAKEFVSDLFVHEILDNWSFKSLKYQKTEENLRFNRQSDIFYDSSVIQSNFTPALYSKSENIKYISDFSYLLFQIGRTGCFRPMILDSSEN